MTKYQRPLPSREALRLAAAVAGGRLSRDAAVDRLAAARVTLRQGKGR